jgi:SP family facilitated glucose transporter-like MFS transporter 8
VAAVPTVVAAVLGAIIAMLVIDKIGRVKLLAVSVVGVAASNGILAAYFHLYPPDGSHTATAAWNYAAFFGVCGDNFFFNLGLGPIPYVLMSELVPAAARGKASSIALVMNWIVMFGVVAMVPFAAKTIGNSGLFTVFGSVAAASVLFTLTCVPETKLKTMEEIQAKLFGVSYSTGGDIQNN